MLNLMVSTNPFLPIILLRVTPSANRNTYSVATLIIHIPRVEALRTSTLGYEIATPTELPGVRTIQHGSPIPALPRGRSTTHHVKYSKKELPPLGGGMGMGFQEGLLLAAVFVPAKAGLFERP